MSDIFLSYAREDRDKAKQLADALSRQGWTVWWDREILPGKSFDRMIEEAMASCKCAVVLWSKYSIESDWVRGEAEEARNRRILIPVLLDNSRPPMVFRYIQAVDLSNWRGDSRDESYQSFLQAVSTLVPRAKIPPLETAHPSRATTEPTRRPVGLWVLGLVLLVTAALALVFFGSGMFLALATNDKCVQGYVWREASPQDHVCVPPATRAQAQLDNAQAQSRIDSANKSGVPGTCKQGYVWREAFSDDHVCVTPATREQTADDNRQAQTRIQR